MKKCGNCKHIVHVGFFENLKDLGIPKKPEYRRCNLEPDYERTKSLVEYDYKTNGVLPMRGSCFCSINREEESFCGKKARWFES